MKLAKLIIVVIAILQLALMFYPTSIGYYIIVVLYFLSIFFLKDRAIYLLPLIVLSPVQSFGSIPLLFYVTLFLFFNFMLKNKKIDIKLFVLMILSIVFLLFRSFGVDDFHLIISFLKASILIFVLSYSEYDKDFLIKILFILSVYLIFYKLAYALNKDVVNNSIKSSNLDSFGSGKNNIYYDGEWVDRLVLPLQDPNYSIVFLLLGLGAGVYLVNNKKINPIFFYIGMIVIFIQILFTYSRTGIILSLLFYILGLLKLKFNNIIMMFFLFLVGWYYLKDNDALIDRIMSIQNDKNASDRMPLWGRTFDLWWDNILFGNGVGAVYRKIGDASHNTFLHLLAEIGLLGVITILFLYIYIAKYSLKIKIDRLFLSLMSCFVILINTISFLDLFLLSYLLFMIFLMSSATPEKSKNQKDQLGIR